METTVNLLEAVINVSMYLNKFDSQFQIIFHNSIRNIIMEDIYNKDMEQGN